MSNDTVLDSLEFSTGKEKIEKGVYVHPKLIIFGRMEQLTMATSTSGSKTDSQYPRCSGEGGKVFPCYS